MAKTDSGLKESAINEITGQICIASILNESKIESANILALLNINTAIENTLKLYCLNSGLIREHETDSEEQFHAMLSKTKEQNKIVENERSAIKKFHELSHQYHQEQNPKVDDAAIVEYLRLAKILLAHLFDFRASKDEWEKMKTRVKKTMIE